MQAKIWSFLILMGVLQQAHTQSDTLFYIGDPMCSWCYGFSGEIMATKEKLPEDIAFQVVLGGLRPEGTETMEKLGDFLQHHWEDVAKASGEEFSYGILEQKDFVYNTEPSCRAIVTARALNPKSEMAFFRAVQRAFYLENKDTGMAQTYAEIAASFGMYPQKYTEYFLSEKAKTETKEEFALARAMGVNSFPTVILKHDGDFTIVAQGYLKAEKVIENINNVLAQKEEK